MAGKETTGWKVKPEMILLMAGAEMTLWTARKAMMCFTAAGATMSFTAETSQEMTVCMAVQETIF